MAAFYRLLHGEATGECRRVGGADEGHRHLELLLGCDVIVASSAARFGPLFRVYFPPGPFVLSFPVSPCGWDYQPTPPTL